ncbi:hypothetical protein LU276_07860 [Moraxella haemolytica]|uniref:hypothetical protein n=1 Tax=Moraxella TaxID=475 RepID=UPI0025434818|nr:hypothetical protein [Moraxella sp. ZY171148]WII94922.1 hypothetical protein LU276_07860 [Moraxella sp. ZY171148]
MATFSPTLQFSKRWLATPAPVKQAFHQELDDIIKMLGSNTHAKDYQFTHTDFNSTILDLIDAHQGETAQPAKIVHSIDTTPLASQNGEYTKESLAEIEARISTKLSTQLDSFLGEHLAQLSEDLKSWISTTVKNELAEYQKNDNQPK